MVFWTDSKAVIYFFQGPNRKNNNNLLWYYWPAIPKINECTPKFQSMNNILMFLYNEFLIDKQLKSGSKAKKP